MKKETQTQKQESDQQKFIHVEPIVKPDDDFQPFTDDEFTIKPSSEMPEVSEIVNRKSEIVNSFDYPIATVRVDFDEFLAPLTLRQLKVLIGKASVRCKVIQGIPVHPKPFTWITNDNCTILKKALRNPKTNYFKNFARDDYTSANLTPVQNQQYFFFFYDHLRYYISESDLDKYSAEFGLTVKKEQREHIKVK